MNLPWHVRLQARTPELAGKPAVQAYISECEMRVNAALAKAWDDMVLYGFAAIDPELQALIRELSSSDTVRPGIVADLSLCSMTDGLTLIDVGRKPIDDCDGEG